MSIRTERQKAVEEHRKFLEDNTKDEQSRYDKAKTHAAALDEQNKALISQINDKKKELDGLNAKIKDLETKVSSLQADIKDLNDKKSLQNAALLQREMDYNRKVEITDHNFNNRKAGLDDREKSLNDKEQVLDEKSRANDITKENARKEQAEANKAKEAAEAKIAELKDLMYEHTKNIAKYDQDRAKLKDEQAQVDKDSETNKTKETALNTKELAIKNREKQADDKEKAQKDKDIVLDLKEASLNKREKQVSDLIEIHNLRDKI